MKPKSGPWPKFDNLSPSRRRLVARRGTPAIVDGDRYSFISDRVIAGTEAGAAEAWHIGLTWDACLYAPPNCVKGTIVDFAPPADALTLIVSLDELLRLIPWKLAARRCRRMCIQDDRVVVARDGSDGVPVSIVAPAASLLRGEMLEVIYAPGFLDLRTDLTIVSFTK